jgi:hypothetical protein
MKLLMIGLVSATMLMACGGAKEEKEAEAPAFCDCIKGIKENSIPEGCDKVMKDITEEEFTAKSAECK